MTAACVSCGSKDKLASCNLCHEHVCPSCRFGLGSLDDGYSCVSCPLTVNTFIKNDEEHSVTSVSATTPLSTSMRHELQVVFTKLLFWTLFVLIAFIAALVIADQLRN